MTAAADALCTECFGALHPNAPFCTNCGRKVPNRSVAPPDPATPRELAADPATGSTGLAAQPGPAGVVAAGPLTRLSAFVVDLAVAAAVSAMIAVAGLAANVAAAVLVTLPVALLGLGAWSLLQLALTGATIGKLALGIRVVGETNGGVPGLPAVSRRAAVYLGTAGIVGLTVLFARRPRRQGWHDRAAGVLVLDTQRGSDPLGRGSGSGVLRRAGGSTRRVDAPVPGRSAECS